MEILLFLNNIVSAKIKHIQTPSADNRTDICGKSHWWQEVSPNCPTGTPSAGWLCVPRDVCARVVPSVCQRGSSPAITLLRVAREGTVSTQLSPECPSIWSQQPAAAGRAHGELALGSGQDAWTGHPFQEGWLSSGLSERGYSPILFPCLEETSRTAPPHRMPSWHHCVNGWWREQDWPLVTNWHLSWKFPLLVETVNCFSFSYSHIFINIFWHYAWKKINSSFKGL